MESQKPREGQKKERKIFPSFSLLPADMRPSAPAEFSPTRNASLGVLGGITSVSLSHRILRIRDFSPGHGGPSPATWLWLCSSWGSKALLLPTLLFMVLFCHGHPRQSRCQNFRGVCDRVRGHGSLPVESQFFRGMLFVGGISRFGASTGGRF